MSMISMIMGKGDKYSYTNQNTKKKVKLSICEGFIEAMKGGFLFRTLAIILLTLTGHKVRLIVEETVEKVGYGDTTSKSIYVMKVVFYCYIYNFAILLLMNNASIASQQLTWLSWIPSPTTPGQFTDFSTKFYGLMGDLFVLLLLFNVFFQLLFEVFIQLMVKCRKIADKKGTTFEDSDCKTKCESIE